MKLHQLAALVTASECGSLRQAAAKMRLSQPALSRSIRELEIETGVKLMERTALGVKATVYGEALILRSKIVDAELRHAREDIAHLKAATHGDLRIGATPVAAFSLLPVVLARFKKSRPQLRVTISDGMGEHLLTGLRQGDFDIVFGRVYEDIDSQEFAVDVLFDDRLVVVARRGHPLAQARRPSKIDWEHLVSRFGEDWRVLLSHLVLFGYIFPSEKHHIPSAVMSRLVDELHRDEAPQVERLCRGTLLSRAQYLADVAGAFRDARLEPRSSMTREDVENWTRAIEDA